MHDKVEKVDKLYLVLFPVQLGPFFLSLVLLSTTFLVYFSMSKIFQPLFSVSGCNTYLIHAHIYTCALPAKGNSTTYTRKVTLLQNQKRYQRNSLQDLQVLLPLGDCFSYGEFLQLRLAFFANVYHIDAYANL